MLGDAFADDISSQHWDNQDAAGEPFGLVTVVLVLVRGPDGLTQLLTASSDRTSAHQSVRHLDDVRDHHADDDNDSGGSNFTEAIRGRRGQCQEQQGGG